MAPLWPLTSNAIWRFSVLGTQCKQLCRKSVASGAACGASKHQRRRPIRSSSVDVRAVSDLYPEHLDARTAQRCHVGKPVNRRLAAIRVRRVDVKAVLQAPNESIQIAAIRVVMKLGHSAIADAWSEQRRFVCIGHGVPL